MKIILILAIMTTSILTSCDSPRSQRMLSSNTSTNGLSSSGSSNPINLDNTNSNSNSSSSTTSNTSTSTSGTSSTNASIPSDASKCKFSTDGISGFESTSSHLGDYTLCQSSTDKSIVYFQLKTAPVNTNGDVSICLIPTTSSGANAIYVGNPMCGYFKDPKNVRKINFIKYPQYSNADITGVIFFKDLSWYYPVYNSYLTTLDAYKTCMNMLAYGNTAYCQSFKNVGQYVYKQF